MEKLKNTTGSTMLVTMVLIAAFSILLVGFNTAIIAMTSRLDGTYSEKQAYLYSRSAVTALADELVELSEAYDAAWYIFQNTPGATEDDRPVKTGLLAKVDELSETNPVLTLNNIKFDDHMVDGHDLEMSIERIVEGGVEAYKVSATTKIYGMKEVTDTVALKLSVTGQQFDIVVEGSGAGGSGDSFSGIYTDNLINFMYDPQFFKSLQNGATVVCASPGEYLVRGISGGETGGSVKNIGDLSLWFDQTSVIENIDFYVYGNFTIRLTQPVTLSNCNIYVSDDFKIEDSAGWATIKIEDCKIKSGSFTNKVPSNRYIEENTSTATNSNLTLADLGIPASRPTPAWVSGINPSAVQDFARGSGKMVAGGTYKLTTGFGQWHEQALDDTMLPEDKSVPVTIIVPSSVTVGINTAGGNIKLLVEPGAFVHINPNNLYNSFEGDIYSYSVGATYATIKLEKTDTIKGTIIVPKLDIATTGYYSFGGGGSAPSYTTETISYNLLTDYIYVRG